MKKLNTYFYLLIILTSNLLCENIEVKSTANPDESINSSLNVLQRSDFLLDGSGPIHGFVVTGYNWGRKRIHRPDTFPIEPYTATINHVNFDTAIKFYNSGTANIKIDSVYFTSIIGDSSAFKFDRTKLLRTVNSGDTVIIPVTFHPTITGNHYLEFRYVASPKIDDIKTTLQGIGIIPRIETYDIDFGATSIDNFNSYSTKQMTIRNLSSSEWQYGDSVTIANLNEVNINPDITTNWTSFIEPFRYDKLNQSLNNGFSTPIVLQPGDSLTFNGEFHAKSVNLQSGSLTTVSDAESEATSNWIGYDSSYVNVEDDGENGFSIYPNPSTNTINLRYRIESAGIINIYLTDVLGNQTLLKSEYKFPGDYVETFNLNVYPQGIYNIVLQSGDMVYSDRVLILR